MTTLTDMEILGELGWTNQIIMDQSGGLIPKFWRPPYGSFFFLKFFTHQLTSFRLSLGDVDNRVRAIALEVFGMSTVIWNHVLVVR
jgi:chitin deacetylase